MLIKSPLGKRFGLWFEHTWILFTQRCFVPSLIEICPLGLEEKITKCLHIYFRISLLSSLWKKCVPLFEQTWTLITEGCFVTSLVEIGQDDLEKKNLNVIIVFSLPSLLGTRGPQALTVTWVSKTLHWLLVRGAHICISTAPSKN